MRPRHLTGLPGNVYAGVRLAQHIAARAFSLLAGFLFATASLAASNVIQYTYDAAGNITNITRQSTGGFAITSFTPSSGPVGTAVTIYGMGFSATPANNAVTFNGTAATVTASDSGSIATMVPSGATTGRIAVTVGGVTVMSSLDFVVTVAGAPTITSFTPTTGAAGTSVSITGTNFNPSSGATTFAINGVAATGSATSATAGTLSVPGNASSGRIAATTSVGTGSSVNDFIIPPSGLVATDIEAAVRISAGGGNSQVRVGTANRSALVLFDGTVNGWYSLQFNALDLSPTTAALTYKVIKPDNTVLVSGSLLMSGVQSIHLPKLPASGTYTLQLSPGIATLNTMVRLEANPVLVADGADAAIAQDYNQQTSRFVFDATSGQRVGFGLKGLTFNPSGSSAVLYFYAPDGSGAGQVTCAAASGSNLAANCDYSLVAAASGTYQVITGQNAAVVGGRVQISSPATGTLASDVMQTVSLTRVGQQAAYTFAIAAGDSVGVDVSNLALAPQSGVLTATVLKPDGTQLVTASPNQPASGYLELGANQPAGTYTVFVEPANGAYGTFNITLKAGTVLTTTSSPTSFAPAGIAENVRARFTATAGQTLSLGVGSVTDTTGSGAATVLVNRADRSTLDSVSCNPSLMGGNCRIQLDNLAAGTYSVVVKPASGAKITGTVALSSDLTGTLTPGTTQSLSVTRVGQRSTYTFTGNTGDNIGISMFAFATNPATEYLTLRINKPDGTQLFSKTDWRAYNSNVLSLPATGTYTAIVNSDGPTFGVNLLIDPGTLLTVNGSTASLSADANGRPLRFRFAGTAGQRVDLGIYGLSYAISSGSTTSMVINAPDGSNIDSVACSTSTSGSCDYTIASLGATGTYVVLLVPPAASQINAGTFAVSTPLTGTFVVGDPAQSISISRAGQTARYTFSGTSGQTLRFSWSSVSVAGTGSVAVTVITPGGATLNSNSFANGASGGFDISTLPSTGTYTVVLDPPSGTTMSGSFSLVTR
jgi:hypothetical protein